MEKALGLEIEFNPHQEPQLFTSLIHHSNHRNHYAIKCENSQIYEYSTDCYSLNKELDELMSLFYIISKYSKPYHVQGINDNASGSLHTHISGNYFDKSVNLLTVFLPFLSRRFIYDNSGYFSCIYRHEVDVDTSVYFADDMIFDDYDDCELGDYENTFSTIIEIVELSYTDRFNKTLWIVKRGSKHIEIRLNENIPILLILFNLYHDDFVRLAIKHFDKYINFNKFIKKKYLTIELAEHKGNRIINLFIKIDEYLKFLRELKRIVKPEHKFLVDFLIDYILNSENDITFFSRWVEVCYPEYIPELKEELNPDRITLYSWRVKYLDLIDKIDGEFVIDLSSVKVVDKGTFNERLITNDGKKLWSYKDLRAYIIDLVIKNNALKKKIVILYEDECVMGWLKNVKQELLDRECKRLAKRIIVIHEKDIKKEVA